MCDLITLFKKVLENGEVFSFTWAQTFMDLLGDTGWSNCWVTELKLTFLSNAGMKAESYVLLYHLLLLTHTHNKCK